MPPLSPPSPPLPPRRQMALRNVASSRQPSPCPISTSRQTHLRRRLRMDGSLLRHDARRTDVLSPRARVTHRSSIAPSWHLTGSLRTGSLCRHVEPCACAPITKNLALEAASNRILSRTGETFWQAESYDHWVGDEKERTRIAAYIENNPVKAGLVTQAEDYKSSSAYERRKSTQTSLGAPDTSVRATLESKNL